MAAKKCRLQANSLAQNRRRQECGRELVIVTPGVRPREAGWDDQKRVMTPAEAIRAGSDYLVVGKPIRDAKDPKAAARELVLDMARAFAGHAAGGRLRRV